MKGIGLHKDLIKNRNEIKIQKAFRLLPFRSQQDVRLFNKPFYSELVRIDMKKNRTHFVGIRFTEDEYKAIEKELEKTVHKELSHFIRLKLLDKPVIIKYKNESLDTLVEELIIIRQELNAIGNNFNQAVKRLHIIEKVPEFRQWLQANEATRQLLIVKTEQIQQKINQISDKWLQE